MVARLDPLDIPYFRALVSRRIDKILSALPLRERRVLEIRYGLDGHPPRSLREVGAIFGVTGEWIRRIESRALKKLARNGHKVEFLQLVSAWHALRFEPVLLVELVSSMEPDDLEELQAKKQKVLLKALRRFVSWLEERV